MQPVLTVQRFEHASQTIANSQFLARWSKCSLIKLQNKFFKVTHQEEVGFLYNYL